jgi:glutathione S-transferase
MLKLYWSPGTASLVVHWLLIELDAEHELHKLDDENR